MMSHLFRITKYVLVGIGIFAFCLLLFYGVAFTSVP